MDVRSVGGPSSVYVAAPVAQLNDNPNLQGQVRELMSDEQIQQVLNSNDKYQITILFQDTLEQLIRQKNDIVSLEQERERLRQVNDQQFLRIQALQQSVASLTEEVNSLRQSLNSQIARLAENEDPDADVILEYQERELTTVGFLLDSNELSNREILQHVKMQAKKISVLNKHILELKLQIELLEKEEKSYKKFKDADDISDRQYNSFKDNYKNFTKKIPVLYRQTKKLTEDKNKINENSNLIHQKAAEATENRIVLADKLEEIKKGPTPKKNMKLKISKVRKGINKELIVRTKDPTVINSGFFTKTVGSMFNMKIEDYIQLKEPLNQKFIRIINQSIDNTDKILTPLVPRENKNTHYFTIKPYSYLSFDLLFYLSCVTHRINTNDQWFHKTELLKILVYIEDLQKLKDEVPQDPQTVTTPFQLRGRDYHLYLEKINN